MCRIYRHCKVMRILWFSFSALFIASCLPQQAEPPQDFFNKLSELCGNSYAGKVISSDPQDADWAKETLIMHVRDCSDSEIKIPLHVGENRSRTWIVTLKDNRLTLKHDHRHEDGKPDAVTMYGGTTNDLGTHARQAFPVDQFSKDMFVREGLDVSVANTWFITLDDEKTFTYALSRPNRDFRAQFDLTKPVDTPPPVWGHE